MSESKQSFSVVPGRSLARRRNAPFCRYKAMGIYPVWPQHRQPRSGGGADRQSARMHRPARRAGADRSGRRPGAAVQAAAGAAISLRARISGLSMERQPGGRSAGCLDHVAAACVRSLSTGDQRRLPAGARCAVTGRTRGHRQPRLRHHAGNRGGWGGCRIGRLEGRRHAAGDQAHSRARPCRG
jgi:hypothetical protein